METRTVLERLPEGARVAVIRLRSLGDCALTTPALSLLKQARPDLRVAVVAEAPFAPVFRGNPDIDCILPPNAAGLWRWRPALTLNLHGGMRSLRLTLAARSAFRAGFAHFRYSAAYNVRIPRAQEILGVERKVHTAEHMASAMFYLGVPHCEVPRARVFAGALSGAAPAAAPAPYAVLHPFASAPDKTWPAANFLALADILGRRFDLDSVFIAGPGEDLSRFRAYRCVAGAPIERLLSLLAGAALFAGNDSGPAHLAAACGAPAAVFFGASDPEIWGPWKTESAALTAPGGIQDIAVDRAAQAIAGLRAGQPALP